MPDESALDTSATMLARVQNPADREAWNEFVARYGPRIKQWCLRWNVQEADADDVTQEVLLRLAQKMRDFRYDPTRSFRAWLKTVTHHAWRNFVESQRRGTGSGDSAIQSLLNAAEAPDSLVDHLDEEFERALTEEAMACVRSRVAPHTWEAFRLLVFEQLPGVEVASRVNMQVAMVYVARSKVQKLLKQEIDRLRDSPDQP
jgi:RNA polymerase sigma-70 factor (ECF subfamily)